MPGRILSSDPDAGLSQTQRRVLSSDPNAGMSVQAPDEEPERTWGDTIADALPWAGGAVGGTVGAIGGTVLGMGVGGVPGAMGGAALGGGAGEAARQTFNRFRGVAAPSTAREAATDIGTTAAIEGALAGAGGMVGKYGVPIIKGVVKNMPGSAMVKGAARELGEARTARAIKRVERPSNIAKARQSVFDKSKGRNVALEADDLSDMLASLTKADAPDPLIRPSLPDYTAPSGAITRPANRGAASYGSKGDLGKWVQQQIASQVEPAQAAQMAESAFTRNVTGDPARQQLVRELMRAEADDLGGSLTQSGRSMFTPEEASMFENALRELRSGSLNRAQSIGRPLR